MLFWKIDGFVWLVSRYETCFLKKNQTLTRNSRWLLREASDAQKLLEREWLERTSPLFKFYHRNDVSLTVLIKYTNRWRFDRTRTFWHQIKWSCPFLKPFFKQMTNALIYHPNEMNICQNIIFDHIHFTTTTPWWVHTKVGNENSIINWIFPINPNKLNDSQVRWS